MTCGLQSHVWTFLLVNSECHPEHSTQMGLLSAGVKAATPPGLEPWGGPAGCPFRVADKHPAGKVCSASDAMRVWPLSLLLTQSRRERDHQGEGASWGPHQKLHQTAGQPGTLSSHLITQPSCNPVSWIPHFFHQWKSFLTSHLLTGFLCRFILWCLKRLLKLSVKWKFLITY